MSNTKVSIYTVLPEFKEILLMVSGQGAVAIASASLALSTFFKINLIYKT